MPSLAVFNEDGQPETVKYHELPVQLSNEVQCLEREVTALRKQNGGSAFANGSPLTPRASLLSAGVPLAPYRTRRANESASLDINAVVVVGERVETLLQRQRGESLGGELPPTRPLQGVIHSGQLRSTFCAGCRPPRSVSTLVDMNYVTRRTFINQHRGPAPFFRWLERHEYILYDGSVVNNTRGPRVAVVDGQAVDDPGDIVTEEADPIDVLGDAIVHNPDDTCVRTARIVLTHENLVQHGVHPKRIGASRSFVPRCETSSY